MSIFQARKNAVIFDCFAPSPEKLVEAHKIFEERELRASDYWLARERVRKGVREGTPDAIAEAIAGLLKSWHKAYYRWRPAKVKSLVEDLRQLIVEHSQAVQAFSGRSLTSLGGADRVPILLLFSAFETKLGPVGGAKALNLLVPDFFPLWDDAIAYRYGVLTDPRGYFLFMVLTAHQVTSVTGMLPGNLDVLKVLDEYNYCRYTKGWME